MKGGEGRGTGEGKDPAGTEERPFRIVTRMVLAF
jgi:hypothetical protein